MLLDESRFPLVFLTAHDESDSSLEEQAERNKQLEDLLNKQKPFVLIAEDADHDHDDETPEERKAKALFFKSIKGSMKKYCLGLVVIEGDSPNAAVRIAAAAVSKAIGFSVQFASDTESAVAKGLDLLAKASAKDVHLQKNS